MSSPHDAHGSDAHGHAHDDAPADGLGPDESPTPAWLTVLGAVLFVGAALVWIVTSRASNAPVAAPGAAPAASAPSK